MNQLLAIQNLEKHFDKDLILNLDLKTIGDNKDFLSQVYENILNKEKRKEYAQFFTHKELVKFIISHLPINNKTKILDPACGVGAFLIEAYDKNNKNLDNIYGLDIDNKALDLCKLNLKLSTGSYNEKNFRRANTLKGANLKELFPEVYNYGGFDLIIGNPPFQNLNKDIDYIEGESLYGEVLSGLANSATLMIAKGYEFLKENGYLAFVLPKNIIRVESFKKLRDFLIKNTKLICIYDLDHYFKDVRGDQIILIFQKTRLNVENLNKNYVKIMIYKKGNILSEPYNYEIPQSDFLKYDFFPILNDKNLFKLADRLLAIRPTLSDVCSGQIFRGLSINPKQLQKDLKEKEDFIFYKGDSITRFGTKYGLYLNYKNLDKNQLNKIKKLQVNKLILQNICSKEGGIFATISNSKELNLDTVTNIIPTNLDHKYLLGMLNSKLSNFFIISVVFLNSNFTMHTDKKYIGNIPIVIPKKEDEQKVINIVNNLLNIENKYSKEAFSQYNELNKAIFDIYNISDEESELINNFLNEVMSKKQNGRTYE